MMHPVSSTKFTVRYEYFGLCTSADVYPLESKGTLAFKCLLPFSGEVVEISGQQQGPLLLWVEGDSEQPTARAQILGQAIENVGERGVG